MTDPSPTGYVNTVLACPTCGTSIESVTGTGEIVLTPSGQCLVSVIAPCGHHVAEPHPNNAAE